MTFAHDAVNDETHVPPSRWAKINGRTIHYTDSGSGPAIVLIHGLGADLTRWEYTIPALSKQYRVIAIDLIGFGESEKPLIPYRGKVFVEQVLGLLNLLNIEKATFVGNSMGGWISLLFAKLYSHRVDRLALVAPAFVFGLPNGVKADGLLANASPQTADQMQQYLGKIYHQSPTQEDDHYAENLLKRRLAKGDHETIRRVAISLENKEDTFSEIHIAEIKTNTLIIHGTGDGIVPVASSLNLHALLNNSEIVVIEEAGHWPQMEKAEAFNDTLMSWLNQ